MKQRLCTRWIKTAPWPSRSYLQRSQSQSLVSVASAFLSKGACQIAVTIKSKWESRRKFHPEVENPSTTRNYLNYLKPVFEYELGSDNGKGNISYYSVSCSYIYVSHVPMTQGTGRPEFTLGPVTGNAVLHHEHLTQSHGFQVGCRDLKSCSTEFLKHEVQTILLSP